MYEPDYTGTAPVTEVDSHDEYSEPEPLLHSYRLVYDSGRYEDIQATSPSRAVAARSGGHGSALPHTVSDLSSIRAMRYALLQNAAHRAPIARMTRAADRGAR